MSHEENKARIAVLEAKPVAERTDAEKKELANLKSIEA